MNIVAIDVYPLTGATVDGGWPQGHEPQENLHTLLIVRTDDGLVGYGSCFTSGKLVAGAVELLWPLLRGRVGRRARAGLRDAPPVELLAGARRARSSTRSAASTSRSGTSWARRAASRSRGCWAATTGGRSSLTGRSCSTSPSRLRRTLEGVVGRGFRAIKLGWRPFGRRDRAVRRAARADGPAGGGRRRRADGRRRRERAVLAARHELGAEHGDDARRLRRSSGSRSPCRPTTSTATSS